MKKRDVKYSKENIVKIFRELRDFISHNKRRIGTTSVAAITSFIAFTSAIAPTMGCNPDDAETLANEANDFVNEQTVKPENTTQDVDIPVDVKPTVEPEKNEPVTQDPVEPVEEVNPRDMKAVYGLDFDVPIYTEEEVEIAKENLRTKYQDYYNVGYLSADQADAIKDDFYIANQDFFYQLYDMTKDLDRDACVHLHLDKHSYYYDSEKDWIIEINNRGGMTIYGKDFIFDQTQKKNEFTTPNSLSHDTLLAIGPGSYVDISGWYLCDSYRNEIFMAFGDMSEEKYDVKQLENVGYRNEELKTEFINYEVDSSLSLK